MRGVEFISEQYLQELSNAPYSWKWLPKTAVGKIKASFKTHKGITYEVSFVPEEDDTLPEFNDYGSYEVEFYIMGQNKKFSFAMGSGDQFKVFATVIDILKNFLFCNCRLSKSFGNYSSQKCQYDNYRTCH